MQYVILGIGCLKSIQEEERLKWERYDVTLDFADDVRQAAQKMNMRVYSCAVVCSDHFSGDDFNILRKAGAIPILVLPIEYAEKKHTPTEPPQNLCNFFHRHTGVPYKQLTPPTVITVRDLWFCLEHRSVEVRGQKIDLTAKEFDILALLIMNQKRVFTYEMLMEMVWQEDSEYYSRKAIHNHISRLNRKLKIAPDVPAYIKSIRGVGYKFEI